MDDSLLKKFLDLSIEGGVGIGYGQTKSDSPSSIPYIDQDVSNKSKMSQAYLLARNPWIGFELGHLQLPEYNSRAWTDNYPLYKGIDPSSSSVQSADIRQDIKAHGNYKRMNVYGPKVLGVEPYGFYGKAKVKTDNHEYGTHNKTNWAEYKAQTETSPKYYGLGLEKMLSDSIKLRMEYGRIPKGSSSYHTGDRDFQMGTIGLGYKFK